MLAVSMRMMRAIYSSGGEELRDALAHDWWIFFQAALPGLPVILVPNTEQDALDLVRHLPITALLLTGGDDWGVFPQRDRTEALLFQWALHNSLPVLGVCRGAQLINRFMGGKICTGFGKNHVRIRHHIELSGEAYLPFAGITSMEVNSYHNLGIRAEDLAPGLEVWATASDGSIEAFSGNKGKVVGIMWHPEREESATEHDINLMRYIVMRKSL